jgi:hypothetical protein
LLSKDDSVRRVKLAKNRPAKIFTEDIVGYIESIPFEEKIKSDEILNRGKVGYWSPFPKALFLNFLILFGCLSSH